MERIIWDATCVDTFSQSNIGPSAIKPGSAAKAAEERKIVKYRSLSERFNFYPIAIENVGVFLAIYLWNPSAALVIWLAQTPEIPIRVSNFSNVYLLHFKEETAMRIWWQDLIDCLSDYCDFWIFIHCYHMYACSLVILSLHPWIDYIIILIEKFSTRKMMNGIKFGLVSIGRKMKLSKSSSLSRNDHSKLLKSCGCLNWLEKSIIMKQGE